MPASQLEFPKAITASIPGFRSGVLATTATAPTITPILTATPCPASYGYGYLKLLLPIETLETTAMAKCNATVSCCPHTAPTSSTITTSTTTIQPTSSSILNPQHPSTTPASISIIYPLIYQYHLLLTTLNFFRFCTTHHQHSSLSLISSTFLLPS